MREIEGIEEVVQKLKPYWEDVLTHFNEENARFMALTERDHDVLGRILKCHLILEHYLDRFLSEKYGLNNLDKARLTFFQKTTLLPDAASAASVVKPGIIRLNTIRNRFSHDLAANVDSDDLGAINELLDVAREGVEFGDSISRIEAFTTIACTWLIVPPPHLEQLFLDAFSTVRIQSAETVSSD